jgi:hypothetical protein
MAQNPGCRFAHPGYGSIVTIITDARHCEERSDEAIQLA